MDEIPEGAKHQFELFPSEIKEQALRGSLTVGCSLTGAVGGAGMDQEENRQRNDARDAKAQEEENGSDQEERSLFPSHFRTQPIGRAGILNRRAWWPEHNVLFGRTGSPLNRQGQADEDFDNS